MRHDLPPYDRHASQHHRRLSVRSAPAPLPVCSALAVVILTCGLPASPMAQAEPVHDPRIALADSLRVLDSRARRARRAGDVASLIASGQQMRALLPDAARVLRDLPLPPPGDEARAATHRLAGALRRFQERGAWVDSLATRVERLAIDDPDRPRLALVVGLAYEDDRRQEDAAPFLERAALADHPLAPDARLRAARVLYRLSRDGDDGVYRERAVELLDAIEPDGPRARAAALLALELECSRLGEEGVTESCGGRAERWLRHYSGQAGTTATRLLLAEARERAGDLEGAEASCLEVVARHPGSNEAADAWSRYLRLRRKRDLEPTPTARYLAAVSLARRGERRDAVKSLERLIAEPEAQELHVRAHILLGRTLRQLGRYDQAITVLDEVESLDSTVRERHEAGRWLARALWSARRIDDAKAQYEALIESGSGTTAVLSSWELGRMLEDDGRLREAREAFTTLARSHPRDVRAAEAAWRAGLCSYRLGDFDTAIADFSLARPAEQSAERERRLYWLGRAHEGRGDTDAAAASLAEAAAIWPRDYYGWRAATRLQIRSQAAPTVPVRLAAVTEESAPASLEDPGPLEPGQISGLTDEAHAALKRGLLSLELGLLDDARRELRIVEKEAERDPEAMLRLADAYQAHGIYDRAVSCGWDARHRSLGTPEELVALRALYPLAFPEYLFANARTNAVDPLLVLALMRRESRFNPTATSGAGARGLMQLMPRTAAGVARQMRIQRPTPSDLHEPGLNMKLGTWYLASVLRDFTGRPDQALASYNAGRRKVEEWQQSLGTDDPDLFVELIGYTETRNYVKKVLNDYFYYQLVYRQLDRP